MTTVDYLVVGSGLTGSTIARLLHDEGREVMLLERRDAPGGNVRDTVHPSGIPIHLYGPHYFRCASAQVWEFVNRCANFYRYRPTVKIRLSGVDHDWPISVKLLEEYPDWIHRGSAKSPSNFEEACLQKMPLPVYEAYVKHYTLRQWGIEPRHLAPSLASRIHISQSDEGSLTPNSRFQGLPLQGYSQMMTNMIAGIPCCMGVDFLQCRSEFRARKEIVFTGPIDEFFRFEAGHLQYRAHRHFHEYLPHCERHQPCVQVNHLDEAPDGAPLRTIEWKHLLPAAVRQQAVGTIITRDHPFTPQDPDHFEYPVPTSKNFRLYAHYRRRAAAIPKLTVCGRLGSYTYLDMDHAIAIAFRIAKRLLDRHEECPRVGTQAQGVA
jgi:UDP-galactopyranose mutase